MATITEIRNAGTELVLENREILEPLSAPKALREKLKRFGDHYDLSQGSHLYRFILAICGEAGTGALKRAALIPKLTAMLDATYFSDLDNLYGNPLGLPRLNPEVYTYDPSSEILTQEQWQEIKIKDAEYRSRCLTWMRAIINGSTPIGMSLAAEAAIGVECDIVERYQFLDDMDSDEPGMVPDVGKTMSRNEFTIVPRQSGITQEERRRILHLVDKLRPVNSIVTVYDGGTNNRLERSVNKVAASSHAFFVQRLVTGRPDINWPESDPSEGFWIDVIEKAAPYYAFMDRQEAITYLTIEGASASSEHVGNFNSNQRALFGHLRNEEKFRVFDADDSFTKSFAPIVLTSPWINE